jgi:hypothetical protein
MLVLVLHFLGMPSWTSKKCQLLAFIRVCCSRLSRLVSARLGYAIPGARIELEEKVRGLVSLSVPILEPEKVPMQIGNWFVYEILEPVEGSEWTHEGYFESVRERVQPIGNATMKRFYPKGNEHNRERATLLVKGGNIDFTSIETRECRSTANPSERFLLFRAKCIPSMKTEVASANEGENPSKQKGYIMYVAFDMDGKFCVYPFSCCGCYDGRGCCSHQLAMLGLFRQIKRATSQAAFEKAMPPPPIDVQNIPTLIESVCISEIARRRAAASRRNTNT